MKRSMTFLLALAMMCVLASCSKNEQSSATDTTPPKTGLLADVVISSGDRTMVKHLIEAHNGNFSPDGEVILYNNISSALLALESDEIQYFGTNSATANYVVANNDEFKVFYPSDATMQNEISMMTLEENTEVYDLINDAIVALKEDGTLELLIDSYAEAIDHAVELPTFEGADTLRVAITGDVPPLDYITADGTPSGFNVALLAAIAERTGINIEPVIVESSSRFSALASGKVDAIFWACSTTCKEHSEVRIDEFADGTKATEPYIILDTATVCHKSTNTES